MTKFLLLVTAVTLVGCGDGRRDMNSLMAQVGSGRSELPAELARFGAAAVKPLIAKILAKPEALVVLHDAGSALVEIGEPSVGPLRKAIAELQAARQDSARRGRDVAMLGFTEVSDGMMAVESRLAVLEDGLRSVVRRITHEPKPKEWDPFGRADARTR